MNKYFLVAFLFSAQMRTSVSFVHRQQVQTRPPKSKTILEISRRDIVSNVLAVGSVAILPILPAFGAPSSLADSLQLIQQARKQLDPIPDLIKAEKWDAIRAILITPPLADCWAKTSRPLLTNYAESLGDAGGEELEALEGREDAVSHLRYLDMAAYNNVFNPIKTEGETGATKTLLKSYYEDPINEYKATVAAFDGLLKLAP